MLKDFCTTSYDISDTFVGIRLKNGLPQIIFPYGYNISDNDIECRKDILRLISVLQKYSENQEGYKYTKNEEIITELPISSYLYIIQDFLAHGYYTEKEVRYISSSKGKINWKRTIQQEHSLVDNGNIVYLDFQIKTNQINQNNLLMQIHQYCVYRSFVLFGWLYFSLDLLPPKPTISFNKNLFLKTLQQALNNTFNDNKRKLFISMINIINAVNDTTDIKNCSFGVNKFELIWEKVVDFTFGIDNKDKYFPHAKWHILKQDNVKQCNALEPDTIMKYNDRIYVLDAKYYKYGITSNVNDLPTTSSIQKQITYGKHIHTNFNEGVYNAFIIPYMSKGVDKYKFIGIATADWEQYNNSTNNYAYVLGILVDTKWLMSNVTKNSVQEVEKLSTLIEESLMSKKAIINIANQ